MPSHPPLPAPPLPMPLLGPPSAVPVGTVVAFAGEVAPSKSSDHVTVIESQGWMVCDGRSLSVSEYPELFAALGYRYSLTSGGETFLIPDLRGYFLRGVDEGSGNDPDTSSRLMVDGTQSAAVGSLQQCALQIHEHKYMKLQEGAVVPTGDASTLEWASDTTQEVVSDPNDPSQLYTSQQETRPKNVAMYYLIRFTAQRLPWMAPLGGSF